MWDEVSEVVKRGVLDNVGIQDPRMKLYEVPWKRLPMWVEWVHHGLQTREDPLERVAILSPILHQCLP